MPNIPPEDQDLVRTLSREVVAEIAPGELATFEDRVDAYFADPAAAVAAGSFDDTALGSGTIDPVTVTTIVATAVSTGLVILLESILDTVKEEIGETVKAALHRLFRRKASTRAGSAQARSNASGEPKVLVFNLELPRGPLEASVDASALTEKIVEAMVKQGFGKRKARTVARAVVARFATDAKA